MAAVRTTGHAKGPDEVSPEAMSAKTIDKLTPDGKLPEGG
jgi:hypothetical protein